MFSKGLKNIQGRFRKRQHAISTLNPRFRAFSHLAPVSSELLFQLDEERAAGRLRGEIHGMCVGVKGNIPVAGLPWTEGSAIFARRIASRDAQIVKRARLAGGIIIGTTTLSELAMYGVENAFEPMGLNPWDIRRTAGGSSTGGGVSAALDLADINIGTDSGGSIRNPACHCGVVGFMPSIGVLTLEGKSNHTPSLSTVGLIAKSVATIVSSFTELKGREGKVAKPHLRLVVPRRLIEEMSDAPTSRLFQDALTRLSSAGFDLIERDIDGWLEAERAAGVISLFECGQSLAKMDLANASEGIRKRAEVAKDLRPDDVSDAKAACNVFRSAIETVLTACNCDAVITPTWPFAAPLIHAETVVVNGRAVSLDPHRNCFVRAANAINACALTLPTGLYPNESVPSGLHLMTMAGEEELLLIIARLIESALPSLPPPPPLRSTQ